jgi:hypothetical protein
MSTFEQRTDPNLTHHRDVAPTKIEATDLTWRQDGNGWLLTAKRRKFGLVIPDGEYPGMWRPVLSGGRLGDMANLSWCKSVTWDAAARELE